MIVKINGEDWPICFVYVPRAQRWLKSLTVTTSTVPIQGREEDLWLCLPDRGPLLTSELIDVLVDLTRAGWKLENEGEALKAFEKLSKGD